MNGDSRPARPTAQDRTNDRLDSWKEIAAYLKKEVRTVQRWEKSSGLPVRRLAHGKQGTVFAYKSELDAWWQESQSKLDGRRRRVGCERRLLPIRMLWRWPPPWII